jgi:uncharacterized repeat protein (TIGR01451 family)
MVPFRAASKRGRVRSEARVGVAAGLVLAACGLTAAQWAVAAPPPAARPVAAARPAAVGSLAAAPFVYVTGKGGTNEISEFASLGSGALRALTPKNVASGVFPYDVAVNPQGTSAYAVDNPPSGGEVSQYTISPVTGRLTPKSPRTVATAGSPSGIIAIAPDGRNAYVPEAKGISQYRISPATGKLTPMSPRAVADPDNPTGIRVAPDGRYVYITNVKLRLGIGHKDTHASIASAKANTVSVYRVSPVTGALSARPVQTVATGSNPQMITIAPDGKSAYVTGTDDNTIWQYSISPATGRLTPKSPATVPAGHGPHDLAVSPDGKNLYVVSVGSDTIAQYRISRGTGRLSTRPVSTARTEPAPEAIALSPDGKNAYVTSEHEGALSQFAISPATGKITPLSPATVTAPPHGAFGVAVTPAADLSAKVSAPATARHGSSLTYTIKITDKGPSAAWQLVLADHLPAGTAFRAAAVASGHCSHPRSGSRRARVTCHLSKLDADGTWRIRVRVTVEASSGATIRDRAAVTSVTPDPRTGNNTATAATKIVK